MIETDKVSLEVAAEADGVLHIQVPAGTTVPIGTVVATLAVAEGAGHNRPYTLALFSAASPGSGCSVLGAADARRFSVPSLARRCPANRTAGGGDSRGYRSHPFTLRCIYRPPSAASSTKTGRNIPSILLPSPEPDLAAGSPRGMSCCILKRCRPCLLGPQPLCKRPWMRPFMRRFDADEPTTRKTLTPIRQRIAERLVQAKQQTAMLTTFNEIDMSRVMAARTRFKEAFQKKHGVSLGFMGFFIKASIAALKDFPEINAFIDAKDIVYHHYYHIGIAVGSERGLVVPVLRHADRMGFADLEKAIASAVDKTASGKLGLSRTGRRHVYHQ